MIYIVIPFLICVCIYIYVEIFDPKDSIGTMPVWAKIGVAPVMVCGLVVIQLAGLYYTIITEVNDIIDKIKEWSNER